MAVEQLSGPAEPSRTRRLPWVAAVVLVVLAVAVVAAVFANRSDDLTAGPEVPGPGSPSPSTCPQSWSAEAAPTAARKGPLVPRGATEALLCTYPFDTGRTAALGGTHRLAADPAAAVAYFNGLPTKRSDGSVCNAMGRTQHIVVFGYADRPPAVVVEQQCSWDQSGAVRFEADLKQVTAFWGIDWNDV